MKHLFTAATLAAILSIGAGHGAQAGYIDFTDATWATQVNSDSDSSRTRSIGGFGNVTIQAFNADGSAGKLTFFGDLDNSATPCGFLACDKDGAGINDDEVTFGDGNKTEVERLLVTVENAFTLDRLHFLDLFAVGKAGESATETAQFQINGDGGPGGLFDGTATDGVGYGVTGPLGFINVTQLEFFADTFKSDSSPNSDFALAAIQSVPGPATLAMFGAGLLALGGGLKLRRRTAA